jgi:uncharacterized membrane protein
MCRLRGLGTDSGSVLLLVMGLVPILAGLIAVGTDLAVLFTHRRSLAAEADSAALAAAQAADLRKLYTKGELTELPLDCQRAREIVDARVGSNASGRRVSDAVLVTFVCRSNTVSVRIASTVELPFASHFGVRPDVEVGASSAARSPFQ